MLTSVLARHRVEPSHPTSVGAHRADAHAVGVENYGETLKALGLVRHLCNEGGLGRLTLDGEIRGRSLFVDHERHQVTGRLVSVLFAGKVHRDVVGAWGEIER